MSKEEKRYYQPEMNEFHYGFRYEVFEDFDHFPEKSWHPQVYGVHGANPEDMDYVSSNNMTKYRVKHVDREDIESFGFSIEEPLNTKANGSIMVFKKDVKHRGEVKGVLLFYNPISKWLLVSLSIYWATEIKNKDLSTNIELNIGNTIFAGTIKNKSEFKKLLEQLNIT